MSRSEDFNSISPSAKSLLLLKANTDIPFAKELASLMTAEEVFGLNFKDKDLWFWLRVLHFETRYKGIELLLKDLNPKRILEICSGYSLRGLDHCLHNPDLHYIDTDLPEVIAIKRQMVTALDLQTKASTCFEMEALNIFDEDAFWALLDRLGDGAITIVNEGLLMYLNMEEKKQVCKIIHAALKKRDGYWITGDAYVKIPAEVHRQMPQSDSESSFLEQHKIEENKFDSYEAAEDFFKQQGLELVQEAVVDMQQLSAVQELVKILPPEMRNSKNPPPKLQATWLLRAV